MSGRSMHPPDEASDGPGTAPATAAIAVVFIQSEYSPVFGTTLLSIVASPPWLVLAARLLYDPSTVAAPRTPFGDEGAVGR